MSRKVIFRFDASTTTGGGHAYRCLTLARALADAGWKIVVAASAETFAVIPAASRYTSITVSGSIRDEVACIAATVGTAELLVVDHYQRDADFESMARAIFRRILVIDDLANREHDADILLDQTYGRSADEYVALVPRSCEIMVGATYALLRPEFAAMRETALARRTGELRHILVSLGSTDPDNVTSKILKGLHDIDIPWTADVVLGRAAPHIREVRAIADEFSGRVRVLVDVDDMATLMTRADLAFGATGSTSWERCCLGLPSLAVVLAENQRRIANELAATGAIELMKTMSPDAVHIVIERFALSPARMRSMSASAATVCDGNGTRRVVGVLQ